MVMVFDCESIPDCELLKKCWGLEGEDLEIIQKATEINKEQIGNDFLPLPFHKIISIAAVFCDEFGNFVKVGNFPTTTQETREKDLISGFFDYLNSKQPLLVSFNGRGFDMPVLLLRSMAYNISANAYFEVDNPEFHKTKWENYRTRYSEHFHLDLFDTLSHYGSARGLKLDVLSTLAGFVGKYDIDGSKIVELYYQNQQNKIDEYCQSDVLNTYGLYLKYQLLKGAITQKDYAKILLNWEAKLPKDKDYSEIFTQAIQKELQKVS